MKKEEGYIQEERERGVEYLFYSFSTGKMNSLSEQINESRYYSDMIRYKVTDYDNL